MRYIYLVRHAMPHFPDGEKYCIGQSDFPLGKEGRLQAKLLKYGAKEIFSGKEIFCSRLSRVRETAEILCDFPSVIDGLEEMHAGLWDGLSFKEIEKEWPEVFAKRDGNKNIPIPGAEDMEKGLQRFIDGVYRCLDISEGDIVIVAHSTVIQAFLSYCANTELDECRNYKLSYCSVSKVSFDGRFHLEYYGNNPPLSYSTELYRELIDESDGDLPGLLSLLVKLEQYELASQIDTYNKSGQ